MKVLKTRLGAVLSRIICVLSVSNVATNGTPCFLYETMKGRELKGENCAQFVYGTQQHYNFTIQCLCKRKNCSKELCNHLATCFNESERWGYVCYKGLWRRLRLHISTSVEGGNASFVWSIHMKYSKCLKRISIKTTKYFCGTTKALTVESPCAQNRQGIQPTCDKLVQGTNGLWLRPLTKSDFCLKVKECFHSEARRVRCENTFTLYYNFLRYHVFPLENGTSHFQITYKMCGRRSIFFTNVIRCESIATSSESEVQSEYIDGDEANDEDLNKEMLKALCARDVKNKTALESATKDLESIIKKGENRTKISDGRRNKSRERTIQEVFLATVAFEAFAVSFAQHHLNRTAFFLNLTSDHVELQIRKRFDDNESDFYFEESKGRSYIKIPSEVSANGSVLLGVVYKNIHKLFPTNKLKANTAYEERRLNTIIMSGAIDPQPDYLRKNVTLAFSNLKEVTGKRVCAFWNLNLYYSPIGWSGSGCQVKWMSNDKTECSCNHLTHFAVLMQFDSSSAGSSKIRITKADERILNILTYVGLTLSLIGITSTIICYAFLTELATPLSQIRISLVTCLGAGQIIFLTGINATKSKGFTTFFHSYNYLYPLPYVFRSLLLFGVCVAVAAMIQYFIMAAFCWMLIEGIYLYMFVVKVYNVSSKMKIYHGVSWGIPAAMVALSLFIAARMDGIKSFVNDEYCWMSSSGNLIWIFVSFVVAVEIINLFILVRVIKEMTTMQQAKDNHSEQIRLGIRACVVLLPLLGVTWLFGALSSTHKAFVYIFVIVNSTQGFFIFVFHCLRNSEIRERFKKRVRLVHPVASDGTSVYKRQSEIKDSSGVIFLRKIDLKTNSTGALDKTTF